MQRRFKSASRLVILCPGHICLPAFKARQHDPQFHAGHKFNETLKPEATHGKIGDAASKPRLARPAKPDPYKDIVPIRGSSVGDFV